MSNMKNTLRRGFTAVELIIVITVMAVVVSVALPRFMTSQRRANETAAISALRTISTANSLYRNRYGTYGSLDQLMSAGLIDSAYNDPRRGYVFQSTGTIDSVLWAVEAAPEQPGTSGDRYFFIDERGSIRVSDGSPADSTSNALDL